MRQAFSIERNNSDYVEFRGSEHKLNAMYGKVKITVRSHDRAGKLENRIRGVRL